MLCHRCDLFLRKLFSLDNGSILPQIMLGEVTRLDIEAVSSVLRSVYFEQVSTSALR